MLREANEHFGPGYPLKHLAGEGKGRAETRVDGVAQPVVILDQIGESEFGELLDVCLDVHPFHPLRNGLGGALGVEAPGADDLIGPGPQLTEGRGQWPCQ